MNNSNKKYGMGGAVQSFSSPMLAQGMQGGLSGFGTSGMQTFADGGQIASIGDSGIITDKNSMFLGKMALITADLGNMYEIRIGQRTSIVKKNGIRIVSDEYADGGQTTTIQDILAKYKAMESAKPKQDATTDFLNKSWEGKNIDDYVMYSDKYKRGGKMAHGGVIQHGLQEGDKIVKEVDNKYLIVASKGGVYSVVDIEKGSRFIVGLDDSKTSGQRKSVKAGVKEAMDYINYIKSTKMANGGKFAQGGMLEDAKIYVADLTEYNNGRLVGKWLDLSDYSSGAEVMEAIQEMLDEQTKKDKYGDVHEEYAIHDFEGFPRSFYSESMGESDFDELYEIAKIADSSNLPIDVLMEAVSDLGYEDDPERVAEAYYSSVPASMGNEFRDFAYEYIDSVGGIESAVSNPESYFDFESFGSDAKMDYSEEELEEMGYNDLSDEELGEQLADEVGGANALGEKILEMYFDYDKFARELEYDFIAVRGKDGDYYFFNRNFSKGGKVKYAKGGDVNSINFDFSFDTDGDYEDRDIEEEKIKYLRTKIDFDEVRGDIDYRREENNTFLRFFKNGELVMRIKGNGHINGVNAEISAFGLIGYLNYHPQNGFGGLNMEQFKREVNRVFMDFSEENKQYSKGGEISNKRYRVYVTTTEKIAYGGKYFVEASSIEKAEQIAIDNYKKEFGTKRGVQVYVSSIDEVPMQDGKERTRKYFVKLRNAKGSERDAFIIDAYNSSTAIDRAFKQFRTKYGRPLNAYNDNQEEFSISVDDIYPIDEIRKNGEITYKRTFAKGGKVVGDSLEEVSRQAKQMSKNLSKNIYVFEDLNVIVPIGKTYLTYTWGDDEDVNHIKNISHNIGGLKSIKTISHYANGDLVSSKKEVIYKNNSYAKGGEVEYLDKFSSAKTMGRDTLDLEAEIKEYAGKHYNTLTSQEREEIIADLQKNYSRNTHFAKGGEVLSEIESKYAIAGKDSGGVWTYSKLTANEIAKKYKGSVQEDGSKWYVSLNSFAKGGKIGFEGLAKKVAKRYVGKKVSKEYQAEYGKTYDAKEAKEVGNKVAGKVYQQQVAKKKIVRKLQRKTK